MTEVVDKFPIKNVLITGGTGLVGKAVVEELKRLGCNVRLLSTNEELSKKLEHVFYWNVDKGIIDEKAFEGVHVIINLSGASIAGGLWTKKRKDLIYSSRVKGTKLLFEKFKSTGYKLQTYIGASAIGIYGPNNSERANIESDPFGTDFLAKVCVDWEAEHQCFKDVAQQVCITRLSNIIAPKEGFLLPFLMLSRFKLKIKFTSKSHGFSWVHINDVANVISDAAQLNIDGTYNIVSGTNSWNELQDRIYSSLGSQLIKLTIPGSLLKLMMGEMATLFINGSNVSNEAISNRSSKINWVNLNDALNKM